MESAQVSMAETDVLSRGTKWLKVEGAILFAQLPTNESDEMRRPSFRSGRYRFLLMLLATSSGIALTIGILGSSPEQQAKRHFKDLGYGVRCTSDHPAIRWIEGWGIPSRYLSSLGRPVGLRYTGWSRSVPVSSVSDWDLQYLAALPALESLDLRKAQVTDEGLRYLMHLDQLSVLQLDDTLVTDSGLAHLARLGSLSLLCLGRTKITGAGLVELAGLAKLKTIFLHGSTIGDEGLRHLSKLKNLSELCLADTAITDAGLKYLQGAKALRVLDLSRTGVTDAGLQHLRGLPALEVLRLGGTAVTRAGEAALLKAFPSGNRGAKDQGIRIDP